VDENKGQQIADKAAVLWRMNESLSVSPLYFAIVVAPICSKCLLHHVLSRNITLKH
jgi:hypothetical protein